jgi:Replication initiator protein A
MSKRELQIDPSPVLPISDDAVDFVRFEKNLLQIGFFGANDGRDKHRTTRRIEQTVYREGQKVKVAAEFRGSDKLGLPTTVDRDKFIGLLKIIDEGRGITGQIQNPVRFSGYRLIQELGLARNGEIYEEIMRWGKRMMDTTITSEKVVYRAAKKIYSDEVLHVFRSFRRTGASKHDGSDRQEEYEVLLEDWLVENLNQRYVVPEDINAYKQLTRPTAKGIFGNLHLWFHASHGKPVEKDYVELCNLLCIQAYPHLSKIKSTMGLALDELIKIMYVQKWDVQPMTSKKGYKIVLWPGSDLMRSLRTSRRELPAPSVPNGKQPDVETDDPALALLKKHGIVPAKARQLFDRYGADTVMDTVEFLEFQISSGKRGKVENPAGLIIYSLENEFPVPVGFISSQRRATMREAAERLQAKEAENNRLHEVYERWVESERDKAFATRYPDAELEAKLAEVIAAQRKSNPLFKRVSVDQHRPMALQIIRKEVNVSFTVPSFEDWVSGTRQIDLFN